MKFEVLEMALQNTADRGTAATALHTALPLISPCYGPN